MHESGPLARALAEIDELQTGRATMSADLEGLRRQLKTSEDDKTNLHAASTEQRENRQSTGGGAVFEGVSKHRPLANDRPQRSPLTLPGRRELD